MKQNVTALLKPFYDENGTLCEQALLAHLLSYATKEEVAKEHASMLLSRIGKLSLVLATPLSMLKEAGLSYIQLRAPVSGLRILILRKSPTEHFLPDLLRHPWIMPHKI